MGESVSSQGDEHLPTAGDRVENWTKSVGDVAAPLLAGFSFTSVIVVSSSVEHFRWPGEAILALTIAATMLIAAVQCAKYVLDESWTGPSRSEASAKLPVIFFRTLLRTGGWSSWTRRFYHLGVVALLAGLAFALAPQHATGGQEILRWVASVLAFVACGLETVYFLTLGRPRTAEDDQASRLPQPPHG